MPKKYPRRPLTLDQVQGAVCGPDPVSKPLSWYRPGRRVTARDLMQKGYSYTLEAEPGKDFAADFEPDLSPQEMLEAGVFSGKYLNDCAGELPREWYEAALARDKLAPEAADPAVNQFREKSRKSLQYWRKKGWIPAIPPEEGEDPDVRGWFQWYCRYWLGRRRPKLDEAQMKRWRQFRRHAGQICASYKRMDDPPRTRAQKREHRSRQRQALLQWAYDPWI
jgi:hypothetical protein